MSISEIKEFKLRKCQKQKPICTLCKWAFAPWTELTAHWKKKHRGQDEYKCDKCDKVTHSLASHKKHILLHEEDKKKLKCFVCGHKFNFKSELDRHNVFHLTDHKHICPTRGCGKSFKMQSTLKYHLKVHDNLKINCPEEGCDYWTTLQLYLKDHLTWYHGPLLICEYSLNGCTYTIRARSSQSRHEEYCPFKPFSTEAEDEGGDGDNGDDRKEGKDE